MRITEKQYAVALAESCLAVDSRHWPKLLNNFYALVDSRGDRALLPKITAQLSDVWDELAGQITVKITSARPLSEAAVKVITDNAKAASGRQIVVDRLLDPKVLGGAIVGYGDRVVDFSLAGSVNQLIENIVQ